MDRRAAAFAIVAILLILFLGRNRILDIVTRSGGFDFVAGGDEVVSLPPVVVPSLPGYRTPSAAWKQSTGLMCACDREPYTSPIIVREMSIPTPPLPRYVNVPAPTQQRAAEPPRSYASFGMTPDFQIWQGRPYEQVWRGSDGRMFLQPKRGIWGEAKPNPSWSNLFIGTDEYEMRDGVIYYGPYQYHLQSYMSATRSA